MSQFSDTTFQESRFCRRPQLYSVKANWLPISRHWDFPQISEEQESWRTGRRKIVRRSDQAQKGRPMLQRCFGSVGTELNCQTSSFLDFPLKVYSASLCFCKICLTKGRRICRGVSLLWIVRRKSSQEQNNKRRLQVGLGVTEQLNVELTYFPTSYGTIYVCFHSWFCRICFDRATTRLFVSATHFFEPWRPWRMNTARVLYLRTRFFQPGSIFFCLTSLILLKQLFLSPSWANGLLAHNSFGLEE